jgi:hypothetical protein
MTDPTIRCGACGAVNSATAVTCGVCGALLAAYANVDAVDPEETRVEPNTLSRDEQTVEAEAMRQALDVVSFPESVALPSAPDSTDEAAAAEEAPQILDSDDSTATVPPKLGASDEIFGRSAIEQKVEDQSTSPPPIVPPPVIRLGSSPSGEPRPTSTPPPERTSSPFATTASVPSAEPQIGLSSAADGSEIVDVPVAASDARSMAGQTTPIASVVPSSEASPARPPMRAAPVGNRLATMSPRRLLHVSVIVLVVSCPLIVILSDAHHGGLVALAFCATALGFFVLIIAAILAFTQRERERLHARRDRGPDRRRGRPQ